MQHTLQYPDCKWKYYGNRHQLLAHSATQAQDRLALMLPAATLASFPTTGWDGGVQQGSRILSTNPHDDPIGNLC